MSNADETLKVVESILEKSMRPPSSRTTIDCPVCTPYRGPDPWGFRRGTVPGTNGVRWRCTHCNGTGRAQA